VPPTAQTCLEYQIESLNKAIGNELYLAKRVQSTVSYKADSMVYIQHLMALRDSLKQRLKSLKKAARRV
jgi:hypothetical protein